MNDATNMQAVALFKSAMDNRVVDTAFLTWPEMKVFLGEHEITTGILDDKKDKDRWMFTAALFKDHTADEYEPAPLKHFVRDATGAFVLDEYGQKVIERISYPIDPQTGVEYVRRSGANVLGYTALVLDFDGNRSVKWAKERFSRYAHCGYTSYSHRKDGRTEKYRMILPFADPCPAEDYELRAEAFLEFSQTNDPSTIAMSRGFYLPQVHPRRAHLAEVWSGDGQFLDWRTFAKKQPWVPPVVPVLNPIEGDELRRWGRRMLEKQLQKIQEVVGEGARHHTVLKVCRAVGSFVACGAIDSFEAEAAIMNEAVAKMGPGRRSEITDMIRSGFRMGANSPAVPPQSFTNRELIHRLLARKNK